eukprot:27174-Prymnesium_polylepis.1
MDSMSEASASRRRAALQDLCCRRTSSDQCTTAQLSSTGLRRLLMRHSGGRLYVPKDLRAASVAPRERVTHALFAHVHRAGRL